jgi:hypothetical protein
MKPGARLRTKLAVRQKTKCTEISKDTVKGSQKLREILNGILEDTRRPENGEIYIILKRH